MNVNKNLLVILVIILIGTSGLALTEQKSLAPLTTTTALPVSTTTIYSGIYCSGPINSSFAHGPHGLYVQSGGYLDASSWNTILQYILPDPTDCGVTLSVPWSRIEPENGTYNWTFINESAAPWVADGKQVNLILEGVAEKEIHEYDNQSDTPAWVLSDGVTVLPASDCGDVERPLVWENGYSNNFDQFVTAVDAHYANDPNIGYIRFGLNGGGENDLNPNSSNQCGIDYLNDGWTQALWGSYVTSQLNYFGSLHLPKLYFADISPWISNLESASAAAASEGVAYEGLDALSVMNYANNISCSDNWCNIFVRYKGKVPYEMQTKYTQDPTNASGGEGSLTYLLPFAIDQMGVQVFELSPAAFYVQDNPTYAQYAEYHAGYQCAFQTAANILVPILGSNTVFNCPPT